jgi:hypothetical protein
MKPEKYLFLSIPDSRMEKRWMLALFPLDIKGKKLQL